MRGNAANAFPPPQGLSSPIEGIPLAAVPNQVCSQCRTNPPSDAAAVFADARDGAAIKDVAILRITAIEDSERRHGRRALASAARLPHVQTH